MQERMALGTLTSKDYYVGTVKGLEKGNTLTEQQKITLINNIQEIVTFKCCDKWRQTGLNSHEEGNTET